MFGFWQEQIICCKLLQCIAGAPLPQVFQESLEEKCDSTQIVTCLSGVFLHFLLKSCRSQVRSCVGQRVAQHSLTPCCHRYLWSLRKIKNAYLTCSPFANSPCFCEQRGAWRGRQCGAGLSVWNMASNTINHRIWQGRM